MGWCGQRRGPATVPAIKETLYLLYRGLGGPQGHSGRVRIVTPTPRFDPQTAQPVASRYTD